MWEKHLGWPIPSFHPINFPVSGEVAWVKEEPVKTASVLSQHVHQGELLVHAEPQLS